MVHKEFIRSPEDSGNSETSGLSLSIGSHRPAALSSFFEATTRRAPRKFAVSVPVKGTTRDTSPQALVCAISGPIPGARSPRYRWSAAPFLLGTS